MHASRQISRGRLLRAKAAPLQASLPSILSRGQKSPVFQSGSCQTRLSSFQRFAPQIY